MYPSDAGKRSGMIRAERVAARDQIVIALQAQGRSIPEIAARLGISSQAVYKGMRRRLPAVDIQIQELQRESVTSEMVHGRLSEMFHADIADIIEPPLLPRGGENPRAGRYRPIHEWPVIWRKMLSGADVKEIFEHSRDGKGASWDKIGEVLKLKFADPLKLIELLGRHTKVAAFADHSTVDVTVNDRIAARLTEARRIAAQIESSEIIEAETVSQ